MADIIYCLVSASEEADDILVFVDLGQYAPALRNAKAWFKLLEDQPEGPTHRALEVVISDATPGVVCLTVGAFDKQFPPDDEDPDEEGVDDEDYHVRIDEWQDAEEVFGLTSLSDIQHDPDLQGIQLHVAVRGWYLTCWSSIEGHDYETDLRYWEE